MTDLALQWDNDSFGADLALDAGQLLVDDGLRTACIVSLFTDKRAGREDVLPEPDADRRGWWGDMLSPVPGWEMGCKLWLLSREKQLPSVLVRAESYARDGLQWMIEDQVAKTVTVKASFPARGWLGIAITIERPTGPARERYDFAWNATENQLRELN